MCINALTFAKSVLWNRLSGVQLYLWSAITYSVVNVIWSTRDSWGWKSHLRKDASDYGFRQKWPNEKGGYINWSFLKLWKNSFAFSMTAPVSTLRYLMCIVNSVKHAEHDGCSTKKNTSCANNTKTKKSCKSGLHSLGACCTFVTFQLISRGRSQESFPMDWVYCLLQCLYIFIQYHLLS